jgi:hypothetical protein
VFSLVAGMFSVIRLIGAAFTLITNAICRWQAEKFDREEPRPQQAGWYGEPLLLINAAPAGLVLS